SSRRRMPSLSPTQQRLFDRLTHALPLSPVLCLHADDGMGKSTLLDGLRRHTGGNVLPVSGLLAATRDRHPLALEEPFLEWASTVRADTHCLLIDDLHLIVNVAEGGCSAYPRAGLLSLALAALIARAAEAGKQLIVSSSGYVPGVV